MLELAIRLVLGAGIVSAAVVGLRWASRKGMTARGGPVLRVVGRSGLTRSSLVAVVDVDGQRFLVGAADEGVRLLADLGAAPDRPLGTDGTDEQGTARPGHLHDETWEVPDDLTGLLGPSGDLAALAASDQTTHGSGRATTDGPRIGLLDRLREMTVRTHLREPIRVPRILRR